MKTRIAFTDFIDDVIYQMILTNRHLSDIGNVSDGEYRVLRFLHKNGEATMTSIASFLNVSTPRTTKIADSLFNRGYIDRHTGSDRRSIHIQLTKKATTIMAKSVELHREISESFLRVLSQSEREQMYTLITKCHMALTQQTNNQNNHAAEICNNKLDVKKHA